MDSPPAAINPVALIRCSHEARNISMGRKDHLPRWTMGQHEPLGLPQAEARACARNCDGVSAFFLSRCFVLVAA